MFKIYQLVNGRFQITPTNPDDFGRLSQDVVGAIIWRSFATQEEAAAFAASI